MDDLVFLRRLPLELFYIVTRYNPGMAFIYPTKEELLSLNWMRLLKSNFNRDYKMVAPMDLMKIYIDCYWKVSRIICGQREYVIIDDDNVIATNFGRDNSQLSQLEKTKISDIDDFKKKIYLVGHGYCYVLILLVDGTLLCRGFNNYGELGVGDFTWRYNFVRVDGFPGNVSVRAIACGSNHTLILLTNGKVMACGSNMSGQLGSENLKRNNSFRELENIKDVVQIACGDSHSFIKLEDGSIMGCGNNFSGQLGLGKIRSVLSFTKIEYVANNVREIVCGSCNTFLLMNDGGVMSSGFGWSGTLAHGDNSDKNIFTLIENLPKNVAVVKIQAGFDHVICLFGNGTVMTCGKNSFGQLGFADKVDRKFFEKIEHLSVAVVDIGTGAFAEYTILRLLDGSLIKYNIE
ncbi:MAG: chromosome condensation regulator [Harvfovirus sp.]|uniref:Chromosome condensation regulator n=1 Tax=Harvfovirus sp. TaxID=2487768 RepID=A0A3G5A699_9VIRU|nr:MAG: chromosome condensation regulator [Harvfovirus sp.]